jgi:hypothetical protein
VKIHYPNNIDGMKLAAKIETIQMRIHGGNLAGCKHSRYASLHKELKKLEEARRVLMEGPPPKVEKEKAGEYIPAYPAIPLEYIDYFLSKELLNA